MIDNDIELIQDIFDNNLYVLAFALKKFYYKDIRPSFIYNQIALGNYYKYKNGIEYLLNMNQKDINNFLAIFNKVLHYDDYEIYKTIFDISNYIDNIRKESEDKEKKAKEELNILKRHIKQNSLF